MPTTYACPKGHASLEADYCSECGTKIQGVDSLNSLDHTLGHSSPSPATQAQAVPTEIITCPDCTTPHHPSEGIFCEVCGYNFATGARGELPVQLPVEVPGEAAPRPSASQTQEPIPNPQGELNPQPVPSATGWVLLISVDPALRDPASPPAPNQSPIRLPLEKSVNLIGRTSQMRSVYPEIALDFDDAVSHRHALLIVQPDQSLIVRDIGSANGTQLNGSEITVMADVPLQAGDELTLGHWTKVQIHSTDSPMAPSRQP